MQPHNNDADDNDEHEDNDDDDGDDNDPQMQTAEEKFKFLLTDLSYLPLQSTKWYKIDTPAQQLCIQW